jgi:hypothetical protein
MARGHQGQKICADDGDRKMWLATVNEACRRTVWRLRAWVLMGNHYNEKLNLAVEAKNVPIEFWGKVVTQDGTPISGAIIASTIRHWNLPSPLTVSSEHIKSRVTSGAEGLFHFAGETGDVLEIDSIEKQDYEIEPSIKRSYGYNTSEKFRANPDSPAIFRMWLTTIKEPLVTHEARCSLVPDGTPIIIDLVKGTTTDTADERGDLRVWIKRQSDIKLGQRYDWACEIMVPTGGLLSETDEYSSMYLAPPEGYAEMDPKARTGVVGRARWAITGSALFPE